MMLESVVIVRFSLFVSFEYENMRGVHKIGGKNMRETHIFNFRLSLGHVSHQISFVFRHHKHCIYHRLAQSSICR